MRRDAARVHLLAQQVHRWLGLLHHLLFPTVHINGAYGKVQPPSYGKKSTAMLKNQKNINLLVDYIKESIPNEHPLVGKGWRALPRGRTTLDGNVAVPSE